MRLAARGVGEQEEQPSVVPPVLHDEAAAGTHDEVPAMPMADIGPSPQAPPDPHALAPWIDDDLAQFGEPHHPTTDLPLADPKALEMQVKRGDVEHQLASKGIDSGHQTEQALQTLRDAPAAERTKLIDTLDPTSFQNLLDRVPESERGQFAKLADSSHDPKRRLQLWQEMHEAKGAQSLSSYEKDFGPDDGTRSDEQQANKDAYDRRKAAVDADRKEVDGGVAEMLARANQGTLTMSEADAFRQRKDLEQRIELAHNTNLVSGDGKAQWTTAELQGMERAITRLPADHVSPDHTVPTFNRVTHGGTSTEGGSYHPDTANEHIDITNKAHEQRVDEHDTSDTFEYTVTHEIGHKYAHDHEKTFEKFSKVAGWRTVPRAYANEHQLLGDESTRFKDGDNERESFAHDASALPQSDEWRYAAKNPQENFAEMYARSVLEPQTLYRDFVSAPQDEVAARHSEREAKQAALEAGSGDVDSVMQMTRDVNEAKLSELEAERTAAQRARERDIIRNDVFGTDRAESEAVARLRAGHAPPETVQAFTEQANRAMTPAQVANIEEGVRK